MAIIEGDVGEYDRLETSLRAAGFDMVRNKQGPVSWRWIGGAAIKMTVEFFCAAAGGRHAGTLYRPRGVVGGKLCAMVLAAGNLVSKDVRTVEFDIDLPLSGGKTRQAFRVTGPGAYLATKAEALRGRTKNKDAYDVVWLAECWPGGQIALADELKRSEIIEDLASTLVILAEEFGDIDAAGAVKYGRFMASEITTSDVYARRSVGAIRALLDALK